MKAGLLGIAVAIGCAPGATAAERQLKAPPAQYDAIIAKHSVATGVPEALIRRVIVRESRYNPAAHNRGHYGMMQIKPATARAMGYQGGPAGLLDADTNLTYAVRYLAGAYRVARGDHDRAVRFYASGYYYDAKRMGLLADVGLGRSANKFVDATAAAVPPAATQVAGTLAASVPKVETRIAAPVPVAAPKPAAAPRVISPAVSPAFASTVPTGTATPASDARKVASSRIAAAASAVGGLERVAAASPVTPDPQAAAYAGGRPAALSPFAGVAAHRAVAKPPLPPVRPTAAAAQPGASGPAIAQSPAPAMVARPATPIPTTQVFAAVPTPPERDPGQATATAAPRLATDRSPLRK